MPLELSTGAPERGTLRRVTPEAQAFVGRQSEITSLRGALAQGSIGRGSVWLIQGEPGIGKSRLCEHVSQLAEELGYASLWGRCWEAGGAPAYWPWLQALRQLLRERPETEGVFAAQAEQLATVMPEVLDRFGDMPPPPSLEPEQARFQLLDAVTRTLAQAAERVPLLVVVEDLHAADASSIALLEFVSKLVQTMRVVIVGTLRDADAMWSTVGPALLRVQRQARVLALKPLSKEQVQSFLVAALPEGGEAPVLDAVYRVTEGHPLFMVETVRLMAARGGAPPAASFGVPATVKLAIRERLAKLSPGAHAMLRAASAFGREVSHGGLAAVLELPTHALEERLSEAVERCILVDSAPGVWRFSHILFQEVLLQELEPAERQRLHLNIARYLGRSGDRVAPSSVLAHHYLRAGEAGREDGIAGAVRAAAEASKQLAFDDAVDWHRAALDALEQAGDPDPRRRCRLLLGLGQARFAAGQVAAAEQTARLAGELARAAGDAELFAEAALARAAAFRFADVDPERVAFLQAALDGLPPGDSGLRARVMARLAAATQPAEDPAGPIELARRAVEMARRVGDPPTLLATVRSAGSALADLGHPLERKPLNQEHIRLAEALNEPVEALRGNLRLVLDYVQVANVQAARATIDAATQIGRRLQHAHYRWVPTLLDAMIVAAKGDFAAWEQRLEEARQCAAQCTDPNAPRTLLLHQVDVLALRGHAEAALAPLPELTKLFEGSRIWTDIAASLVLMLRVQANRPSQIGDETFDHLVRRSVRTGDAAILRELAYVCVARADRIHAEVLYTGFLETPFALIHGGMLEVCIKGPSALPLGTLARLLGRMEDARRHFVEALEIATREELVPFVAWAELELAEVMLLTADDEGAFERLERAIEIAERLDLPDVLARARRARSSRGEGIGAARDASRDSADGELRSSRIPTGYPAPEKGFSLGREGDLWRVRCGESSFLVKDNRGMQMLHRLVEEPGREFHAMDLVNPVGERQDLGDAGETLDLRARSEYERRVADLRAELEEAEGFGDLGRSARAREELDFIARELGRAVGMGQRGRRTGSNVERARVNAQRRIRDAIRRIAEHDAELGRHLDWAVKTGTFCSYSPGG